MLPKTKRERLGSLGSVWCLGCRAYENWLKSLHKGLQGLLQTGQRLLPSPGELGKARAGESTSPAQLSVFF